MKFSLVLALSVLFAACAPPKPGSAAHQQQLADQARKNFYALKAKEQKSAPRLARTEPSPAPPAAPRTKQQALVAVINQPFSFGNPFASAAPKPKASTTAPSRKAPRKADDTVYLYDIPHGPEPTSAQYRAYKIRYARELGKRPENLTSEEREWVRRHYRG